MAPTYAQLESEVWWGREVVTPELRWLIDNLCAFYGVPRTNGGAKGDRFHVNGAHRSQAWILNSRFCTNRTYTVVRGLSAVNLNDIAGFDITLPPAKMLQISRNADRCTRSGELEELVEWYGNVDGDQIVDGWNNIENRIARSDSSHLWHLHGGIHRALLRNMAVMQKIYRALTTGSVEGDDVSVKDVQDALLGAGWGKPLYDGQPNHRGAEVILADLVNHVLFGKATYGGKNEDSFLIRKVREIVADEVGKVSSRISAEDLATLIDGVAEKVNTSIGDTVLGVLNSEKGQEAIVRAANTAETR